ncbi:MAG: outer membrane protein transport protein, partial [Planctomycetota bacterium]
MRSQNSNQITVAESLGWVAKLALATGLLLSASTCNIQAQGVIFTAAGPVNRSMGGASTAAPIDATGALYWNPASISGMEQSETSVSLDLLFPVHRIESTLGGFTGSTDADAGAFPIPNVGVVQHTKYEGVTFGAGVTTLGGFGTNVPADPTNPILTAPPGGLGQISSSGLFLQIVPVLSVALTEQFSVAAGPTITTGRISLEPFVFDLANADGTYSTGNASRYHWGSGFQVGAFYILDEQWRLGASFKSPVWMEKFEFNGLDENGQPRKLTTDLDLPMILSLGTSFQASEQTLFALDAR